jgi:hypothetical protein
MSEWDEFKAEAEKAYAEAKVDEATAVAKIVAEYKELTDKANIAAIHARTAGTPLVHPDNQESLRPPVVAAIGDQPVAPGPVAPKESLISQVEADAEAALKDVEGVVETPVKDVETDVEKEVEEVVEKVVAVVEKDLEADVEEIVKEVEASL